MGIVGRLYETFVLAGLAALLIAGGCGANENATPTKSEAAPARVAEPAREPLTDTQDGRPVIVAFGDSLTAGHGVVPGSSYPDYLQALLDARPFSYQVINEGVSGDTTSGGIMRLGDVLEYKPRIVILELGANDGLRGLPLNTTRANLDELITRLKKSGAEVVLAGMTLPPNYGPEYIGKFEQIFRDLAAKYRLTLIPFLLEGVAGTNQFMQNDGLHPNAEGCKRVADTVFKYLEPLLKKK